MNGLKMRVEGNRSETRGCEVGLGLGCNAREIESEVHSMTRISTQNLELMPEIEQAKRISQSAAMLDAIICPNDWESRYFSFNSRWNKTTMMASMRDGSSNDYFMTFSSTGAILKGFDHESPLSRDEGQIWPGVLEHVPNEFSEFLQDAAFNLEDTTYCIWRLTTGSGWQCGPIEFPTEGDDGSATFLWMFDGLPETYRNWAKGYFEIPVPIAVVRHVYAHKPLTTAIVQKLNPEIELQDLNEDILEIGYPK
jgi:hypothetical protein